MKKNYFVPTTTIKSLVGSPACRLLNNNSWPPGYSGELGSRRHRRYNRWEDDEEEDWEDELVEE